MNTTASGDRFLDALNQLDAMLDRDLEAAGLLDDAAPGLEEGADNEANATADPKEVAVDPPPGSIPMREAPAMDTSAINHLLGLPPLDDLIEDVPMPMPAGERAAASGMGLPDRLRSRFPPAIPSRQVTLFAAGTVLALSAAFAMVTARDSALPEASPGVPSEGSAAPRPMQFQAAAQPQTPVQAPPPAQAPVPRPLPAVASAPPITAPPSGLASGPSCPAAHVALSLCSTATESPTEASPPPAQAFKEHP